GVIAVVSDHGFAPLSKEVNLTKLFAETGFVTLSADQKRVTAWEAAPWAMHGTAAVVLARPKDAELRTKVAMYLAQLQKRTELGIAQIIDPEEAAARGAAQRATFYINFRLGFEMGEDVTAPVISPSTLKGMHGYFPEAPEMRATLVIAGLDLSRSGSLGEVD